MDGNDKGRDVPLRWTMGVAALLGLLALRGWTIEMGVHERDQAWRTARIEAALLELRAIADPTGEAGQNGPLRRIELSQPAEERLDDQLGEVARLRAELVRIRRLNTALEERVRQLQPDPAPPRVYEPAESAPRMYGPTDSAPRDVD